MEAIPDLWRRCLADYGIGMDRADAQIYLEMMTEEADTDHLRTYIRDRYADENQTAELDASIDEQLDILRGVALRVRPRSQFRLPRRRPAKRRPTRLKP